LDWFLVREGVEANGFRRNLLTGQEKRYAKTLIFALKYKYPDTKKPALKAGFFFTCIPRQKTT